MMCIGSTSSVSLFTIVIRRCVLYSFANLPSSSGLRTFLPGISSDANVGFSYLAPHAESFADCVLSSLPVDFMIATSCAYPLIPSTPQLTSSFAAEARHRINQVGAEEVRSHLSFLLALSHSHSALYRRPSTPSTLIPSRTIPSITQR